ncbi:hypothetical protein LADH09A_006243 [Micromonospora sp. LAH09]|uniref:hypothetical protein n=1 Tax=Micromonospora cabrerizensis TaxID=2911213 RepID=UPI001EE83D24|nr:hypothetical protein [Micromonospora cabrerizensis]MCG5472207.1 hypothetical protein [Micromonospora cabrerizensis]
MRPTSTVGVTIALLVALLAGCTGVDRTPTAPSQPSATPSQPPGTTAPGPTGTPLPTIAPTTGGPGTSGAAARVMLRTSGGFAGRGDVVTVEPDGRWTAVDRAGSRRTGRLAPADLGRLTALAADPRLPAEARQTASPTGCADVFTYRVTVGTIETGYVDCPSEATPPPVTQDVVKLLLRATGTHTR